MPALPRPRSTRRRQRSAPECDELPLGQREAVYLFYLSGLSHREAAAELGVSVNAVKARLHQGRLNLGRALGDLQTTELHMQPTVDFVPARILDVRMSAADAADRLGVVLLENSDGSRHLPIFIGLPEARALAFSLENVEMPRPMTYQFMVSLLDACGGRVLEVRITNLGQGTYLARVLVETPTGVRETDARPSDALNLAVLTGAAIAVEPAMFRVPDDLTWWSQLVGRTDIVQEVQERQEQAIRRLRERTHPEV